MTKSEELRIKFDAKIAEYEKAISDKNTDAMIEIEAELKDIEDKYRTEKQNEVFGLCRVAENPVECLIRTRTYDTISHKFERDGNSVVGIIAIYDKSRALDAVKFCRQEKIGLAWAEKCEKLAYYLCEDLGSRLNVSAEKMAEIRKKYGFTLPGSQSQNLGKNPISKNQFCKTLQDIVDNLLFLPTEGSDSKANRIRVINCDVEYIKECFTKAGSDADLMVDTIKAPGVCKVVVNLVHRILTGKTYDIKFKTADKKDKHANAPEVKPEQGSESESKPVAAAKKSGKNTKKNAAKNAKKNTEAPLTMDAPVQQVSEPEQVDDVLPEIDALEGEL